MSSIIKKTYEFLPDFLKALYRKYKTGKNIKGYTSKEFGKTNTEKTLKIWKDEREREVVVLMGNGPSLKRTDWNLLKNVDTIGLNRIGLLVKEIVFFQTYHVCVNDLVLKQFWNELVESQSKKIFDWGVGNRLLKNKVDNLMLIPSLPTFKFHEDINFGWYTGCTVTFAAMELAFCLGYKKVILIGVDHNFTTKGPAHKVVTSSSDDPNHFDPSYFGKGIKWALPDLDGSEKAYSMAKSAFENNGRKIIDCTQGGKLTVFEKSELKNEL
jgi:hypothetical protein